MTGPDEAGAEEADTDEVPARTGGSVPVDAEVLSAGAPVPVVPVEQRAVVPVWVRHPSSLRSVARAWLLWQARRSAFHLVRLPAYWSRLVCPWAAVGAWRALSACARWVVDRDARTELGALRANQDAYGVSSWRAEHRRVVRVRALVAAVAVLATFAVGVLVWALAGPWLRWVSAVVVLSGVPAVLGWAGRPPDRRPVLDRMTSGSRVEKPTSAKIVEALDELRIAQISEAVRKRGAAAIEFVAPIARDGAGWLAEMDLPAVPASEVVAKRSALAAALKRPLGCVWPEPVPRTHEARLRLYVADEAMADQRHVPWPLARRGRVDVFEPVPFGANYRGETVSLDLMFASGLIGAVPRVGKSFSLRVICLAAALDPRCEIHVFDAKGGGVFNPLRLVAHAWRSGDDDDDYAYAITDLRRLQTEMRRRYKVMGSLPEHRCPENKLTPELASDPGLDMPPVLVAVDECQMWFEHPDYRDELGELVADLVKRGPAMGIMVWAATQRPVKASLPTGISANAILRFCLQVTDAAASNLVLGQGMASKGYRADMFDRDDQGIGWLVGDGSNPQIVRAAWVDNAKEICQRARAARVAGGRLTGYAADQDPVPDSDDSTSLDDIARIWPPGAQGMHGEDLARLLAGLAPRYQGWTGTEVNAAAAAAGASISQVKARPPLCSCPPPKGEPADSKKSRNRQGLKTADLDAALAERDRSRASP